MSSTSRHNRNSMKNEKKLRKSCWKCSRMPNAVTHITSSSLTNIFLFLSTVQIFRLCTTTTSSENDGKVGVDRIVWHLVKLFGNPFDYNLIQRCDKLVKFIGVYQPDLKIQLIDKSGSFESAIQGEITLTLHDISSYNKLVISYPIIMTLISCVYRIRNSWINTHHRQSWRISIILQFTEERAPAPC